MSITNIFIVDINNIKIKNECKIEYHKDVLQYYNNLLL